MGIETKKLATKKPFTITMPNLMSKVTTMDQTLIEVPGGEKKSLMMMQTTYRFLGFKIYVKQTRSSTRTTWGDMVAGH